MTRWGQVAVAVLSGIAAALHIGKVPPALPLLRAELGIDLAAAGWLMGLVSAIGAVCGLFIGRLTDQLTHRRSMILGLLLLTLGSLAGAFTSSVAMIFATRAIESIGLIMTVVAGPGLIASVTEPGDRPVAFAVWGVWLPVGVAVMMLASPVILGDFGWRGSWIAAALASLLPMAALAATGSSTVAPAKPSASLMTGLRLTAGQPASWVLAGIFVTYSSSFMSVFGFLPTMLIEDMGLTLAYASVMTAAAVLANAGGNVIGGFLARLGISRWMLIAGPCVMLTLTAFAVFSSSLPLTLRYGAALLYAVSGGLIPATLMGALPVYAPRNDLVGTISGFVMQGSNIGQCAGPLLVGSIVAAHGWPAAPYFVAFTAAAGFMLALAFRRLEGQRVHYDNSELAQR